MFSKINIWQIISDHLKTLVDASKKRAGVSDWVLFLVVPIVFASVCVLYKPHLSRDSIELIITVTAIFAGLLFNVLVLLFDIMAKINDRPVRSARDEQKELKRVKIRILKQTYSNISFSIVESLSIIVFCIIALPDIRYLKQVALFFAFALTANFILTFIMVIKRFHVLLSKH